MKKTGKVLGSGAKGVVYLGFDEEAGKFVAIKELNFVVPPDRSSGGADDEGLREHHHRRRRLSPTVPSSSSSMSTTTPTGVGVGVGDRGGGSGDDEDDDEEQHRRREAIRCIQNEVKLLERARHENIVAYYGSMVTPEHRKLALVMEYVSGGSLSAIIRRHRGLRDAVIRSYGRDILSGLDFLHSVCRTCHRDIKPENILVTPEGRCKLADFGASRAMERTTLLKTCIGTPYYMAPEVVQGEGYDESADVWSFGATLYEMVFGAPPFSDVTSNSMAVMFRVASLGRLPDAQQRASVNPQLLDVMGQCCQVPKSARPTASELLRHPFFAPCAETIVATAPPQSATLTSNSDVAAPPLTTTPPPQPQLQGGGDAQTNDPNDFPFFLHRSAIEEDVDPSRRCGQCRHAMALFSCDACAAIPGGGVASRLCGGCWGVCHAHQRAAGHVKRPLLTTGNVARPAAPAVPADVSIAMRGSTTPSPPSARGVRISNRPEDGGIMLPDGTFVELVSSYDSGGEQTEWTCGRCASVNDGPLMECEMCGYQR